jgi:hypothetical protein
MVRAQTRQVSDPLVDVNATVGDGIHADAQVGGGDGNVLAANIDLGGINTDANVNVGDNGMDSHAVLAPMAVSARAWTSTATLRSATASAWMPAPAWTAR